MNKQQLIKKVARRSGVTEDVVDSILNHTLDEIGMSLLQERRAAHEGRRPHLAG